MALTEKTFYRGGVTEDDSIETVRIRVIYDNGVEIARNKHSKVIHPGQDYSGEKGKIRRMAVAMHVVTSVDLYQAKVIFEQAKEDFEKALRELQAAIGGPNEASALVAKDAAEVDKDAADVAKNNAETAHDAFLASEDP